MYFSQWKLGQEKYYKQVVRLKWHFLFFLSKPSDWANMLQHSHPFMKITTSYCKSIPLFSLSPFPQISVQYFLRFEKAWDLLILIKGSEYKTLFPIMQTLSTEEHFCVLGLLVLWAVTKQTSVWWCHILCEPGTGAKRNGCSWERPKKQEQLSSHPTPLLLYKLQRIFVTWRR